jgi:mannose-1-phosphate guanylyltransferase/mannose-6-phosphate isomerase
MVAVRSCATGRRDVSDTSTHLHAVVLAGGSGARFWPLSREMSPKQLLSIFGGVSLITRAVTRIMPFTGCDAVHIVTGENLVDELRNHLKSQPELEVLRIDYIVEPVGRNTAPAVALAAATLLRTDPEAVMVLLPSDHLLEDGQVWLDAVQAGIALAQAGVLVTIGLKPSRPEIGYGYIHAGEQIAGVEVGAARGHRVLGFVEKPGAATAAAFVRDGRYLWNSGMLITRADTVLRELCAAGNAAVTPASADGWKIADVAEAMAAVSREDWLTDEGRALYGALPSVPFDKAVLEVSGNVAVVPTDMAWSDVGSLLSIEELGTPDDSGNVLVGRAHDVGSRNVLSYAPDRLVATLGLDDVVVVDTADATLVASRDRIQDVRLVVDALKALGAEEVVSARNSLRTWGSWTLLLRGGGFQIKSIEVLPGHRLSSHSHAKRSEHWVVLEGTACVRLGSEAVELGAGDSVRVPAETVHRLENAGDGPLRVVEVSVGTYLGEDDIVRLEDDWDR